MATARMGWPCNGLKQSISNVVGTSRAKLWLARMKRGYTFDRLGCDPRHYRNEKALTKYQYDTISIYKVLAVCQAPSQNKGFARNSYRRYNLL